MAAPWSLCPSAATAALVFPDDGVGACRGGTQLRVAYNLRKVASHVSLLRLPWAKFIGLLLIDHW